MNFQEKIWTYVALVLGVPLIVFALVSWYESRVSRLPVLGPNEHRVQYISLINQQNTMIDPKNWNKKIVVANFFFTRCPAVCPKMTKNSQLVQALNDDNLVINSYTVDPEHDDVASLEKFAQRFGIKKNWNLLTGDKKALYRFARNQLMIVATDGDGGETDFIHSENLVLVDPEGRIRGYYQGTSKSATQQMIIDIRKLEKEYRLE